MDVNDLISRDEITKDSEKRASGEMSDSRFLRINDGKTTVRLLPRLESKIPYKTVYSHRYNKNGEKVFATCRKTLGKTDCPICKRSWAMWNEENKEHKDTGYLVRATPRYMFNCYVVNDPKTPDNNGTIKILSVGKKLFDLILESFNSEDLGPSIFDAVNGVNFEINRKKSGDNPDYPDYSSSRFIFQKGGIVKNWKEIENKLINIDELVKEDSVEELKEKFKFLGFGPDVAAPSEPKQKTEPKKQEPKNEPLDDEDINLEDLEGDNGTVASEKGANALDNMDIEDELENL